MSASATPATAAPPAGPRVLGRHLLLELFDCTPEYLTETEVLEPALVEAAQEAGATVVETVFHRFSPHGLSGVVVIAESHITVHTWPEFGYAAVDVFTCGVSIDPGDIGRRLVAKFGARSSSSRSVERGFSPGR